MYWENELETLNRIDLKKLQVKRLKTTIQSAMNSPYYRNLYQRSGLSADSVNSVEDLKKLPFTVKQNLRDNFLGLLWCHYECGWVPNCGGRVPGGRLLSAGFKCPVLMAIVLSKTL